MYKWRIGCTWIEVHLSFPATVCLMACSQKTVVLQWCLLATLLHEAGHLLVMRGVGVTPRRVVLGAFGIRIEPPGAPPDDTRAMWIALAGPLMNLLVGGVGFLLAGAVTAITVELVLGVFHLLPLSLLDGGQALEHFLWSRGREPGVVMRWVNGAGLILLLFGGAALAAVPPHNMTLLTVALYLGALTVGRRKL